MLPVKTCCQDASGYQDVSIDQRGQSDGFMKREHVVAYRCIYVDEVAPSLTEDNVDLYHSLANSGNEE